jgi:hypothetical protein
MNRYGPWPLTKTGATTRPPESLVVGPAPDSAAANVNSGALTHSADAALAKVAAKRTAAYAVTFL